MALEKAELSIKMGLIDDILFDTTSFSDTDKHQLLQMSLEAEEPYLVIHLLESLKITPNALSNDQKALYLKCVETAAAEGNYALVMRLKQDFIIRSTVTIEFYPESLEKTDYAIENPLTQWKSNQHSRYLRLHQLCVKKLHGLLSHKLFSQTHDIALLGYWRMGIAAQCGAYLSEAKFGVLRTPSGGASITPKKAYKKYFDRFEGEASFYPIFGEIEGKPIKLTALGIRSTLFEGLQLCWIHTEPKQFDKIFAHIEDKVRTLQAKCQNHHGDADDLWKNAIIHDIAEIHWWFAHASPYERGGAAVAKMLSEALFRLAGFEVKGWRTEPDCEALITPLVTTFQANYSQFITELSPLPHIALTTAATAPPESHMPKLLQKFLNAGVCSPKQAQQIMQDLMLSHTQRRMKYGNDSPRWSLSDEGIIAHGVGLITPEAATRMRPQSLDLLFSSVGLDFLLSDLITVDQAVQFEPECLIALLSKNGQYALQHRLVTTAQILDLYGAQARDGVIVNILSNPCIQLMEKGLMSMNCILAHLNEGHLLESLLSEPVIKALENGGLTMKDIRENINILRMGRVLKDFCSLPVQKAIQDGYVSKKEALSLINSFFNLKNLEQFQAKNIPIVKLFPLIEKYKFDRPISSIDLLLSLEPEQIAFLHEDIWTAELIQDNVDFLRPEHLSVLLAPMMIAATKEGNPPLELSALIKDKQILETVLHHMKMLSESRPGQGLSR